MKIPALLAVALSACCLAASWSVAGDGDLTPPPAAKGRPAPITVGYECPRMRLDPCRDVTGGTPVCEGGEWVCENGCKGGPPPCASGKSGQCVNKQWQCVATDGCELEILCKQGTHRVCKDHRNTCVEDECTGAQPECGAGKTAKCEAGGWKCELACDTEPPACAPGLVPRCMGGFGGGWQCFTGNGDGGGGGPECDGQPPSCGGGVFANLSRATCVNGRWLCNKGDGASDGDNGTMVDAPTLGAGKGDKKGKTAGSGGADR